MINVLIVDDHALFRSGLKALFEHHEHIKISGEADDGLMALKVFDPNLFDVVIMDINMPQMDGFETTQALTRAHKHLNIIMLTMRDDAKTIRQVIEAGAKGYLLKLCSKQELEVAISTVHDGNTYFSNQVKDNLLESFRSPNMHADIILTPREKDVLNCISNEMTTQEIAKKLCISSNTVESHRKNLLSKTGCKNAVGLVKFGIQNGLV